MKERLAVVIDGELIARAKEYARSLGASLSKLIESARRERTSSFSQRWQGKFRPAGRQDELYRRLAEKHL